MNGQTKLDEFFAKKSSTSTIKSKKVSIKDDDDEFEKIFQSNPKRKRVELASSPSDDFARKTRRPTIKHEEIDLLDMFKTQEEVQYVRLQPVITTGGQWLSKTKPIDTTEQISSIPEQQRNLMNVQYVSLPSSSSSRINGKSFHKQNFSDQSTKVRKENLRSCYNSLLEDLNKTRSKKFIDDEEKSAEFFDLPVRKKIF